MKTILIFLVIILVSCSPKPQEINYYEDECFYCRMIISDPNFGAELVTKKGKVFKYDSAECMLNDYNEQEEEQFEHVLVTDYTQPNKLIDATNSTFLISENLPSPMGGNLSAYEKEQNAMMLQGLKGGKIHNFIEVVHLYKSK